MTQFLATTALAQVGQKEAVAAQPSQTRWEQGTAAGCGVGRGVSREGAQLLRGSDGSSIQRRRKKSMGTNPLTERVRPGLDAAGRAGRLAVDAHVAGRGVRGVVRGVGGVGGGGRRGDDDVGALGW